MGSGKGSQQGRRKEKEEGGVGWGGYFSSYPPQSAARWVFPWFEAQDVVGFCYRKWSKKP